MISDGGRDDEEQERRNEREEEEKEDSSPGVIDLGERCEVGVALESPIEGHAGWIRVHFAGQLNSLVE